MPTYADVCCVGPNTAHSTHIDKVITTEKGNLFYTIYSFLSYLLLENVELKVGSLQSASRKDRLLAFLALNTKVELAEAI